MARYKDNEPLWLQEIKRCQDRIAASCKPGSYYMTGYHNEEIAYWLNIPQWILEIKEAGDSVNRCLDIGSAYGTLALFCKDVFGCEMYVTDHTDAFANSALLKKEDINFALSNFEIDEFPWDNDLKFDIIILTEVLEHFNTHSTNALKRIYSLLADNGRLFLSTPDSAAWGTTTKYYPNLDLIPKSLDDNHKHIDDHVWQYSKEELLRVLDMAGFYVERFDYSPGTVARHFNVCLRKDFASIPKQFAQGAVNTRFKVIKYMHDALHRTRARIRPKENGGAYVHRFKTP